MSQEGEEGVRPRFAGQATKRTGNEPAIDGKTKQAGGKQPNCAQAPLEGGATHA